MAERSKTARKLSASMVVMALLALLLAITTLALTYSIVSVDNNLFATGTVKINLNDGRPIINEREFIFEPGMTVEKDFFVSNEGSCEIYYRVYFDNIDGGLADILEVSLLDGDKVVYTGTVSQLGRNEVTAADSILKIGEQRNLRMRFHFPESADNRSADSYLSFDMAADGVQVRNNPTAQFV